ncbi:ARM repeat superfamily protein [Actinidia rufa]|uniref:ARM repeat superfamily protein n=1 Tax=Actinidia rufa TaxID=165716 RepID=A0A7J0H381_9ERIC|nr:ARM repeat superfamily protein [Actinidia rufa]
MNWVHWEELKSPCNTGPAVGRCGNDEHSDWRPAEAALYCIRAISDYVSVTEAEVLPQMMSLLPKLPHQPQLLTTVCLTVGAYSKWLHAAPTGLSFLPLLIDIIVSGMTTSEDSAAAAALAFRHICNGSFALNSRHLTPNSVFSLSSLINGDGDVDEQWRRRRRRAMINPDLANDEQRRGLSIQLVGVQFDFAGVRFDFFGVPPCIPTSALIFLRSTILPLGNAFPSRFQVRNVEGGAATLKAVPATMQRSYEAWIGHQVAEYGLLSCCCPSLYEIVQGEGTSARVVASCLQPELVVASLRYPKVFKGLVGIVVKGLCPMDMSSGQPRGGFVPGSRVQVFRGLLVIGHLAASNGYTTPTYFDAMDYIIITNFSIVLHSMHLPVHSSHSSYSLVVASNRMRAMIGEGTFKVSAEDSLHLVEALSMVITELPSDHAQKALEVLCLPAVTPLQEIINQGPLVLGQTTARELTVHIDRLANIFRYVNHPEAVADAIQRLWPIFKAIFDIRAWDRRTMESLCRACKNAVSLLNSYLFIQAG